MLRMTRLTDYAVALLARFAMQPGQHSAKEMAAALHLPAPAVSKVLKTLARNGLLETHRGVKGGITLARPETQTSVAQVPEAFEGPLALTECSSGHAGACELESCCAVSDPWRRINQAMAEALDEISLAEMVGAPRDFTHLKQAVRSRV